MDDLIIRLKAPENLRVDVQDAEPLNVRMATPVKAYQGPKGDPGEPGPKGDTGPAGQDGAQGPPGPGAAVASRATKYQTSSSGTTIPSGTWLDNIPNVPQGDYLWIRTVITWNDSSETTLYSVSRMGVDGSGSGTVSSVNSVSPDGNGNVTLPIDDVPTANSNNPVKSSALKTALDDKQDALTLPLPISDGGTGADNASDARDELGLGTMALEAAADYIAKNILSAAYDLIYASAASTPARLAPNTSSTKKFLRMTGTGSAGTAPAWDTVSKDDVGLGNVENTKLSTWAGSSNITNVGTISSGTWSGSTIAASKGGTGQTSLQATRNAMGLGNTTGALPVANGGTGATDKATARSNLGLSFSLSGTTLTITVS